MDALNYAHVSIGDVDLYMLPTGELQVKLFERMQANVAFTFDPQATGYVLQWMLNNYPKPDPDRVPISPNHPSHGPKDLGA